MSGIDNIFQDAAALPSLPGMHLRMIALAADPATTAENIIDVVQLDPGLTANVLRLANSGLFASTHPIESLREAVIRLGINRILCLMMAGEGVGFFKVDLDGYGLSADRLWRHSVACAFAADAIARRMGEPASAPSAFTAGLLGGVGKVIISPYVAAHREDIQARLEQGEGFADAERAVLGFDHAEAGGRLAEKWNFPPTLVNAIRYRMQPAECPEPRHLAQIAHLAEMLTLALGFGLGGEDELHYTIDTSALSDLGLSELDLETCGAAVGENVRHSAEVMKIAHED